MNADLRENFLARASKHHGSLYDYSLVNYVNSQTKIEIICSKHGSFWQLPIRGGKCTATRHGPRKIRTYKNYWSSHWKALFDYGKAIYINSQTKLEIICKKHGIFYQTPSSHLRPECCPKCTCNISNIEQKWLIEMGIPDDKAHRQVRLNINGKRFVVDGFIPETNTIYEFYGDFWHGNPQVFNSNDLNRARKCTFGELYQKTTEKENYLRCNGFPVVSKWEYTYKKELGE